MILLKISKPRQLVVCRCFDNFYLIALSSCLVRLASESQWDWLKSHGDYAIAVRIAKMNVNLMWTSWKSYGRRSCTSIVNLLVALYASISFRKNAKDCKTPGACLSKHHVRYRGWILEIWHEITPEYASNPYVRLPTTSSKPHDYGLVDWKHLFYTFITTPRQTTDHTVSIGILVSLLRLR